MTGREAYEEDTRRKPTYPHNGRPRPRWDDLDDIAQSSWVKSPSPREWKRLPQETEND